MQGGIWIKTFIFIQTIGVFLSLTWVLKFTTFVKIGIIQVLRSHIRWGGAVQQVKLEHIWQNKSTHYIWSYLAIPLKGLHSWGGGTLSWCLKFH